MKATFVELRKKSSQIIRALDRNEPVTVFYRGKPKAIMHPLGADEAAKVGSARSHAAFGLWAGRAESSDPAQYVRELRQGRFHAR